MKGEVTIEELKEEDLEKDLRPLDWIVQSHHSIRSQGTSDSWEKRMPILHAAFKSRRYGIIVAREKDGGRICAFLDYWIIHDMVENFPIAFLQNMRTLEHLRGKGIGAQLVRKLRDIARDRWHCGEIHVMAGTPADKFYEKCGFRYKPSDIYMEATVNELFGGN